MFSPKPLKRLIYLKSVILLSEDMPTLNREVTAPELARNAPVTHLLRRMGEAVGSAATWTVDRLATGPAIISGAAAVGGGVGYSLDGWGNTMVAGILAGIAAGLLTCLTLVLIDEKVNR